MMFEFVTTETCNSVSTIFNFNSAIFVCKNALKYTAILPNDISRIYLTPCAEPTFSVFLNFEVQYKKTTSMFGAERRNGVYCMWI